MELDWISLLIAVLGGGGLVKLLDLILHRKTTTEGKEIENDVKLSEGWQKLSDEDRVRIQRLEETLDRKDAHIDDLHKEITELRQRCDDLSTRAAVMAVYKCEIVNCPKRVPPFGSAVALPQIKA